MKRTSFVPALLVSLFVSAACSKTAQQDTASKQAEPATAAPASDKIGGSVSIVGVWGGQELEIFNNLVKPFEEKTGIKVEFEATRDLDAVLTTRVTAGNPPDLAALPNPGKMAELARQGKLVDLGGVLDMAKMNGSYAKSWIDLGSVDGKLVGVFTKASLKGLVWYNPKNLKAAGLEIPDSFDKLMGDSKSLADKGTTPWAIGIESGSASGWVGTDWLENIILRMYGPQKYVEWYEGKLPWTSEEVKKAFQAWGKIVADKKMAYGGSKYVLSTNFGEAFLPVYQAPPKAYFHFQAAFIQSFIQKQFPDLKPAEDYDFFALPAIDPQYGKAVEISGDLFGMFKKTPQSAAFIEYLTTAEAQSFWVKAANGISPNKDVPLADYPDPLSKNAAQLLVSADNAVFDGSDMMPSKMNAAFWSAIVNYVANPAQLDKLLADLETTRQEAYASPAP